MKKMHHTIAYVYGIVFPDASGDGSEFRFKLFVVIILGLILSSGALLLASGILS